MTEQTIRSWSETRCRANGDRIAVSERFVVEYHDDSPRAYLRHERARSNIYGSRVPRAEEGVFETVASWEVTPDGVEETTPGTSRSGASPEQRARTKYGHLVEGGAGDGE